ncbi:hypothetical protein ACP3XK_20415, partial [Salmonella enterica]
MSKESFPQTEKVYKTPSDDTAFGKASNNDSSSRQLALQSSVTHAEIHTQISLSVLSMALSRGFPSSRISGSPFGNYGS